jgi:NAD(P)-dependent dehydrogenase (short-subunit alcohol dehydrogenase family)
VDGGIGEATTAARVAETAISTFGSIDALINNAGIFFTKPFTDYTTEDFKRLFSTNLDGFLYVTQLAIKQMLAQKSGGSIVSITLIAFSVRCPVSWAYAFAAPNFSSRISRPSIEIGPGPPKHKATRPAR